MNVIVSNRQKEIIDNANIDAIKDLNGLFNVDDLINKFKNYFFSKMILDATSVVNFASREVLTTLVNEIGAEKLIILLPSNPEPPVEFKKLLIELKIYNFTNNIDDVVKFIENPNTYEDVIKTIDNSFDNNMYVDNSIKEGMNDVSEENEVPDNNSSDEENDFQHTSLGDMLSNFNLKNSYNDGNVSSNSMTQSEVDYSMNESEKEEESPLSNNYDMNLSNDYEDNNNMEDQQQFGGSKNTFLISDSIDDVSYVDNTPKKTIIGIKNVTLHAGSTSLIYMMHKMATITLKKNVLSIEIDKKDFKLYRDSKMISVEGKDIENIIENSNDDIIFVDLNNYEDTSFCTDVIYLVEPTTIKLNKLMIENKEIFKELRNKKVVINQSLLSNNDLRTLSSEAGMDFFYSLGPLNDRIMNDAIAEFLNYLGIK